MRKVLIAVLAVTLALAPLAGCSSSDGGSDFDFNGTWAFTFVVTASTGAGVSPGDTAVDAATIVQSGSDITVEFAGINPLRGTCDPGAGSFTAQGTTTSGVLIALQGRKSGDDTMSGTGSQSLGSQSIQMNWTAERAMSRSAAAPAGGLAAAVDRF